VSKNIFDPADVKLCPLPPCECGGEQIAMVAGNTVVACMSCGRQLVLPPQRPLSFHRPAPVIDEAYSIDAGAMTRLVALLRGGMITPLEARQLLGSPLAPPSPEEEANLLAAIISNGMFK